MKEKLIRYVQQLMVGRYGADEFSKFTMSVAMAVIVLSLFFRNAMLDLIVLLLIGYTYFRIFSRNISKRYAENQKYLHKSAGIRTNFQKQKSMMQLRKTHHIYTCPGCGQKIRIPRGKGKKVEIDCPKCHTKFIKKI